MHYERDIPHNTELMIDLKEIYDNLPDSEYDFKGPKGFRESSHRAYQIPADEFGDEIADRVDIDRFAMLSSYSSKFNANGRPNAVLTSVKLDDGVPTKLRIKVHGKYSDKTYQRTIRTPNGKLDPDKLEAKINELTEQIDPVEAEAEFTKKSAGELGPKLRSLLADAFGKENVGRNSSSKPVKIRVKNDGSVRLQITDMSAEGMMKVAQFIKENDIDLDV